MAKWCLVPEYVDKFKKALKDRTIDPVKLAEMTSESRHKFLSDFVGKDNALNVNSLFESKLLLKNQQAGMINWAKKVTGLTTEARKDLISKIEKMDQVLNPKEGEQFLQDLAQTRLGVGVTSEEAKQIFDLSTKVKETRAPQQADYTFKSEEERLAYGRSKVALMNYVNDLKAQNNLGLSLNPLKAVSTIAGNAKSIKASLDNSALFRQGWKTLFTNPLVWQKNARKSFSDIVRTFGGKKVMDEINADIISRPNYDLMVKAKLAIGTVEEAFPGTVAEKLPVLGRAYKASETAYTGFLYRTRADVFDKYIQIAKHSGLELSTKELQSIGSLVNSLTGRGNFGKYEGSAVNFANNVFFSPRNLKSQFDTLGHVVTGAGGSNFVRKQAAINLVKVISGIAGILATASAVKPGSVEWDSRSSDFGKIKINNTRFDVTAGLGGLAVLASRLIQNSTKSSTTGVVTPLNTGKFGMPTSYDQVTNFFENKFSPLAATLKILLEGHDFNGDPNTPESIAKNLFEPLVISNYEELKKDPNSPNAILTTILDGLGISSNTYMPKPSKENDWTVKPTKSQDAFQAKLGVDKLKEANQKFNSRFSEWQTQADSQALYKNASDEVKQSIRNTAKQRIQDAIFKDYGFQYTPDKKTLQELKQQQQFEKQTLPKKVTQSLLDKLIPSAYASEGDLFGSTTYKSDFKTGQKSTTVQDGIIDRIIKAVTSLFSGNQQIVKAASKDPSQMKLTVGISPNFINEQKGGQGLPSQPAATIVPVSEASKVVSNWKSRYEDVWNKTLKSKGLDPIVRDLIARSENGKEIENYANLNHGDAAGTFDIGITQININPPAEIKQKIIAETKNMSQAEANLYLNKLIDKGVISGEAANLRKPEYAISKAADLYKTRLENLGDPVLAIASYNLGSGGAVLNPQAALNRAKYVYNNAGYELPNTPFVKDPEGYVKVNMSKYKKLGLIR